MIDPINARCHKLIAPTPDDDEAGFGRVAGPRPGREPPDEPTPGDHGPDPDEPLCRNDPIDGRSGGVPERRLDVVSD